MDINKIRNIKNFIRQLQFSQLDIITDFILANESATITDLRSSSRKKYVVNIKRKIAFVARICYNITGDTLVSYLNISKPQVSDYCHSAYEKCRNDDRYLQEIREIMVKLVHYHNHNLRPVI
ncbi:hypothetical protein LY11_04167 [Pedobacter cryoconitis]|uniref:DnaA-like protein n=1 Tax=Pedobacter cryoconitis TaxID=188932 RepID=A0A327S7C2_9SPHI|nr:hypothetical protein LY11_04167 [Pedobacter cryoconitis]